MTPPHALIEVSLFNSQSQHYRLTFVFRHLSYVVKVYNVTSLSRPTSIRVQLDCDKTRHVIVPEFRRNWTSFVSANTTIGLNLQDYKGGQATNQIQLYNIRFSDVSIIGITI